MLGWGFDRRVQRFPRVGRRKIGWVPPGRGLWVWRPRFDTRGCFLLWLNSSRLSGCCSCWLGILKPGRPPGGGLFSLVGRLRDRLRRGFWNRCWSGGGLDNTLPSDDVTPALAQVHMLGRGPGPLSFRSGVALGGEVGVPHATYRGAYPQFRCVCAKRWRRLHCNGPFGATDVFTDTRRP